MGSARPFWEIKEHRRLTGRLEMGRNLWEAAEQGDVSRLEDILPFLTTDQMNYPGGVYGWTALSAAVHGDHAEAVKVLLTFGANPDWQDGDGDCYPCHWACSTEVATILVEAGAHVGKRNRLGETPEDAARRCGPRKQSRSHILAAHCTRASNGHFTRLDFTNTVGEIWRPWPTCTTRPRRTRGAAGCPL